jgi:hypothetical protein
VVSGTKRQQAIRAALSREVPAIPYSEAEAVYEAAIAPGLRDLTPGIALRLALEAHVRHAHTNYDALLADGYDRGAARFFVIDDMNAVLRGWGYRREITAEEDASDAE